MPQKARTVAIIGAGIGGLAAALRLSHAGLKVTVFERHSASGGKMRTVASEAGPIDAGPTVLTMKQVFEDLFSDVGARLSEHLTLRKEQVLARHFWSDGTQLDLMADRNESQSNIVACFGAEAGRDYARFADHAAKLFDAFDGPMMRAAAPSQAALTAQVLKQPSLIPMMAPHRSLAESLRQDFREPKLAQLFARYATYVGGSPEASPAILKLIAHAEAQGVWYVKGGMHQLARAIERLACDKGAEFQFDTDVIAIEPDPAGGHQLRVDGQPRNFDTVLFNGDPRALETGRLGLDAQDAVGIAATEPRSLAAYVHSFAAKASGTTLAAHNVFFSDMPNAEFGPLAKGQMPSDATLYICTQDRFGGQTPSGVERFEIIMNGPPVPDGAEAAMEDIEKCQTHTVNRLKRFGLTFDRAIGPADLTTPAQFGQMFPASNGSLYGRSPHGMMAAFKRPTARTKIPGLYLVGGGAHPGAGIPMATLSAKHAAEAILTDLTSTSKSPQPATHGGMSTASATMARAPSQSSAS